MKHNVGIYSKCANCGACINACPVNAISVMEDGPYYKINIDQDKCNECGLCIRVCPVNSSFEEMQVKKAYGGYHKDEKVVKRSSSGGAFFALAKYILDRGGIVFGAAFADDCHSVVFRSTDEVPIDALMRSKYVESLVGDSFQKVKAEVKKGRKVLFCGTPCQVAGLKRFIGENENLFTCDFACGGLPSHRLYDEYLEELERKYGAAVSEVDFRPKLYGWKMHGILMKFRNKRRYSSIVSLDPFFSSFVLHRTINRDYCYQCDFSDHHSADIILADFWLHKKISDLDNNDQGLSLILVNSDKGSILIDGISECFDLTELDMQKAMYNIKDGHAKSEVIEKHYRFMECVEREGFLKAYRMNYQMSFVQYIKLKIKAVLKTRRK